MNKIMKDAFMIAAIGTAGLLTYSMMSPSSKKEISKDARRTMDDMCDVKQDMAHMAGTIKDTF